MSKRPNRPEWYPLLLLLTVLAGCAGTGPVPLNSERIESTFGSYGIEVLASDDRVRISNLSSGTSEERTTRTLALVSFPENIPVELTTEHEAIVAGGSIGSTFSASGWRVVKENRYFSERVASKRLMDLMRLDGPEPLALHLYEFVVERNDNWLPYAVILELHHPDYLKVRRVRRIYANKSDNLDEDLASRLLETLSERGF